MTPQASNDSSSGTSGAAFGIGVLSSIFSGFGSYESGQQQKKAYDYNADITLSNMRSQTVANTEKYTSRIGTQASRYAASGVDITSGSPLLIMAITAGRGGQQNEEIEQQGTEEANLQRYYGKVAAFSGTMTGIGSFLNGISKDATTWSSANPTPSSSVPSVPNSMFGPLFAGGS